MRSAGCLEMGLAGCPPAYAPCFPGAAAAGRVPSPPDARPLQTLQAHRPLHRRLCALCRAGSGVAQGAQQALGLAMLKSFLKTGFACWFESGSAVRGEFISPQCAWSFSGV